MTGVEHVQDADPDPVVTADTFAYDRAGRMITRTIGATTTGMIWDVSSNLVATTQTGQDRVYVYDVGGQRVAQLNVGSLASATPLSATVYLAATEVTDANTASGSTGVVSATRFITFGGATVATATATTGGLVGWALLFGDIQGSAQVSMELETDTGEISGFEPASELDHQVARNAYGPYGSRRGPDALTVDRGWLGQTEDTGTGLTYLNARYYDPLIGRFLSPDPLMSPGDPRTLDPYRYSDNNPVVYHDRTGLAPQVPCALMALGGDCPTFGQMVSRDPVKQGMIDGGTDFAIETGRALSPEGIAENWNAYAEGVRDAGLVQGTVQHLVTDPADLYLGNLESLVGCAKKAHCIGTPQGQYGMGYGSAQAAAPVVMIGVGTSVSLAFRAGAPAPAMNTWLSASRTSSLAARLGTGGNKSSNTVVVGRDMPGRVEPYAFSQGYGYYAGTPTWIPRTIPGTTIRTPGLKKLDLAFNYGWIRLQMAAGKRVIDIGPGPATTPSDFYNMERKALTNYWNYVRDGKK